MLGNAQSRSRVLSGVLQHGVAPGGRKLIDLEEEAALHAIQTGLYVTWRGRCGKDCTRVGPHSKCFCGHSFVDHTFIKRAVYPRCTSCPCQSFAYMPQRQVYRSCVTRENASPPRLQTLSPFPSCRPEEVGEWWLPRRRGFNVHTWRAKCKCGHGHDEHDVLTKRCRCGCNMFQVRNRHILCKCRFLGIRHSD